MPPVIFGYNNTLFSNSYGSGASGWINVTYTWGVFTFACPGAGAQELKTLGAYARSGGGTPGHVRLAIYDAADNFIAQGSAEILVDSTFPQWIEHTAFVDIVGEPLVPTLTGGANYRIAVSIDSTDVKLYYDSGVAGDQNRWFSIDYTGGFPAAAPAEDELQAFRIYIRGSAEPVGTTYQAEAVDGIGLGETLAKSATLQGEAADGFGAGENLGKTAGFATIVQDGLSLGDVLTAAAILTAIAADGAALSAIAQRRAGFLASVAEAFALSDAQAALLSALAGAADGLTLADLAAYGSGVLSASILDGFTISDTGAIRADFTVTVADAVSIADAIGAVMTLTALATDAFGLGDAAIHIMAHGVVSVSFTVKQATISFTVKKPSISFTVH